MKKVILHVDMDAFFASIEQADNEEYRGKPVVVGADPKEGKGRGVVSAASYEARKFGIRSALPISKAYKLCKDAIFVYPRMKRYSEVSRKIMQIMSAYSPYVEQISVDEAFLDCSGSEKLFGKPVEIAQKIKDHIVNETSLTASIGIASNKSIAKIASDLNKPDGITICNEGEEKQFLAELDISKLWGAGKKTVTTLNSLGFFKIGDIASRSIDEMAVHFGKSGKHLWYLANGIDNRDVLSTAEAQKSVSREHTFAEDTNNYQVVKEYINSICDIISREVRMDNLYAKTLSIKIRFSDFSTFTRNFSFMQGENNYKVVKETALMLFDNFNKDEKKIRLIGVGLTNFIDANQVSRQLSLFNSNYANIQTDQHDDLLDNLKTKYGKKITRAAFLYNSKSTKNKL